MLCSSTGRFIAREGTLVAIEYGATRGSERVWMVWWGVGGREKVSWLVGKRTPDRPVRGTATKLSDNF